MLAEPVIDVRRVKIECPACGKGQYVKLRTESLEMRSGAVSLMIRAACDHEFHLHLDKQFQVRGYERIDAVVSAEMLQVDQEISDFMKGEGIKERASGRFIGKLRNDLDRDKNLETIIRYFRGADVTDAYWISAIGGRRAEPPRFDPAKAFPLPPVASFPAPPISTPASVVSPLTTPVIAPAKASPLPPVASFPAPPVAAAPTNIVAPPAPAPTKAFPLPPMASLIAPPIATPASIVAPPALAPAKAPTPVPAPALSTPQATVPEVLPTASKEPEPKAKPVLKGLPAPKKKVPATPAPEPVAVQDAIVTVEAKPELAIAPVARVPETPVVKPTPEAILEAKSETEPETVVVSTPDASVAETAPEAEPEAVAVATPGPAEAADIPEVTMENLRAQFDARIKKINDLMIKLELDNLNETVSDVNLVKKKAKLSKIKDDLEAQFNKIVSERGLGKTENTKTATSSG